MKVLMNVIIGIIFISCFSFFVFTKAQNNVPLKEYNDLLYQKNDPLTIVKNFCELSESGNYEEIKNYTTYHPDEYFIAQKKSVNLYRQSQGKPPLEDTIEEESDNKSEIRRSIDKTSREYLFVINELTPKEINRDKAFISEIKNVWVKDNQARVRVILSSKESKNYRAERDCLLYKLNGEWKIFSVEAPPLTPVYGMSDQ